MVDRARFEKNYYIQSQNVERICNRFSMYICSIMKILPNNHTFSGLNFLKQFGQITKPSGLTIPPTAISEPQCGQLLCASTLEPGFGDICVFSVSGHLNDNRRIVLPSLLCLYRSTVIPSDTYDLNISKRLKVLTVEC